MSHSLERRSSGAAGSAVSRSGTRAMQREVDEALVLAARVEGTAYLTSLALTHVGNLSNLESQISSASLAADATHKDQVARRAAMLVDNFAITAASEIARRG